MIKKTFIFIIILSLPIASWAQDKISKPNTNESLIGHWQIDLRPTPESEAYYQSFIINKLDGKTFTGSFYGSPIEKALTNDQWPKIYFAFSTADESNTYYHSGHLENGMVYGITYCPNRAFTAPWTGTKL